MIIYKKNISQKTKKKIGFRYENFQSISFIVSNNQRGLKLDMKYKTFLP